MILIISDPEDVSTNLVLEWLSYYNKPFIRLDADRIVSDLEFRFNIELNSIKDTINIIIDGAYLDIDVITSIWFRRSISSNISELSVQSFKDLECFNEINKTLNNEYLSCNSLFYNSLSKDKRRLGRYNQSKIDKNEVLKLAMRLGIDIPSTLITNSKSSLIDFIRKHKTIVTKAITQVSIFKINSVNEVHKYLNYTEEITIDNLQTIPETFFYSLFQEKLNKELEIRSFYLDRNFYSMAIFSQLEAKTSVDFRKYSNNRNVPYKLPKTVELKLIELMTKLNLNTGSIDIVKTKDNRFVFLEVNPAGQYGMTSNPCNYYLDRKIAEYLIND